MMRRHMLTALVAAFLGITASTRAHAQWAVFDASNYAQNVLQAARALQQINNQIQSLQNEAVMLENMARNLQSLNTSSLNTIVTSLGQVDGLMAQGQGIAFNVNTTESTYAREFPQQYASAVSNDQLVADAHTRWQDAMDAFQQTLTIQAQVATNVTADTGTLSTLVNASQGAVGSLQAQQATNQLLALSIKQQLQTQQLMAAQYRAQESESQEQARAAAANFLGSGTAYTAQ